MKTYRNGSVDEDGRPIVLECRSTATILHAAAAEILAITHGV
jgi:hypothetical protein